MAREMANENIQAEDSDRDKAIQSTDTSPGKKIKTELPTKARKSKLRVSGKQTDSGKKRPFTEDSLDRLPKEVVEVSCAPNLVTNETSALLRYKAFKSSREFLATHNHTELLERIFKSREARKIVCPNEGCGTQFLAVRTALAHMRNCTIGFKAPIMGVVPNYKRARLLVVPHQYDKYADYRDHPGDWAIIPLKEKKRLISEAAEYAKGGLLPCINPKCRVKSVTGELDAHITKCCLPEYFQYMGHIKEFRKMDRKVQSRMVREGIAFLNRMPCLNRDSMKCEASYSHAHGLLYHLDRCGLRDEERPWKCYRCGYLSTVFLSREHLKECNDYDGNEVGEEMDEEDELVDGQDNEASGISGEGDQAHPDGRSERRLKRQKLKMLKKKQKPFHCVASIARGEVPDESSRTSISSGRKRYKFKSLDSAAAAPTSYDRQKYQLAVEKAENIFNKNRDDEELCKQLLDLRVSLDSWIRVTSEDRSEFLNEMLARCSIPLCLPRPKSEDSATPSVEQASSGNDMDAQNQEETEEKTMGFAELIEMGPPERLPIFQPRSFKHPLNTSEATQSFSGKMDVVEGCTAFCGGPISTIQCCPRQLENGRECVAVTVLQDHENGWPSEPDNRTDYVQFWSFLKEGRRVAAEILFIMEVKRGMVLCTIWCPSLRHTVGAETKQERKSTLIGMLAVGTVNGSVDIYGIPASIASITGTPNDPCVWQTEPNLTLQSPQCCFDAPIISVAWNEYNGSSKIAAVSVSGEVLLWNLDGIAIEAVTIFEDTWVSPPAAVAFAEKDQLAVSFREKMLRLYDLSTNECIIEENTPRTAGVKVASCQRLFPGIISYDGDCITMNGRQLLIACYITMDTAKTGFFVVPIANRHEVATWDVAICPRTGLILTAGADGRLKVSLNGRLSPREDKTDFVFNGCRTVISLKARKNVSTITQVEENQLDISTMQKNGTLASDDEEPEPICTNLESASKMFKLDLIIGDNKTENSAPLSQYSLNLRLESLNRVSPSQVAGGISVCGGEAGILIFYPCNL
ncbi:hypothetical protein AB6A40_005565 [Gnathostoma spinigerum]|uniref:C2H2-type domain-containing protein n=1 Tax=Gnathostoma spinigerum TaxID=75299 RepID=A0ABD6EHZ9_9BILA